MDTKQGVVLNTTKTRKGLLAGFIVAFATILCAMVLAVTAFAGEAGDSGFGKLVDLLYPQVAADNNDPVSYQYESLVISDSSGGEESDENATIRSVTVHFTNNYDVESARKEIANPQTLFYEDGKSFNFEVALKETALGAPRKITLDEDLDLSYVISNDDNHILFTSENGIYKDTDIDLSYGNEETTYNIKYFYQGPSGEWRDDSNDVTYTGEVYSKIPTQADIDAGFPATGGFSLDTYDVGVALPGGIGYASVYYARDVNTVVFDDNGGLNGPGTIYARSGNKFDVQNKEPKRAGYTFRGWWTDPEEGTQVDVSDGYTVTTDKKVTLYAHWEIENPNNKYITVTYWGQNADLIDEDPSAEFNVNDYSMISEAYFDGQTFGDTFQITSDSDLQPYSGGIITARTKVEKIDTDNDGTLDHNIEDCYCLHLNNESDPTLNAKVDNAVTIKADNYTTYNVYLKRVKYTWEFYDSASYSSRQSRWSYGQEYGFVTARWGQSLASTNYEEIRAAAYPNNPNEANWVSGYGDENYLLVAYLKNMNLTNRLKTNTGKMDNAFGRYDLDTQMHFYYYMQKLDAPDDPSNLNNYEQFSKCGATWGQTYSDDEWLNINGFVTPTSNTAYAPRNGSRIYDNDKFFYKRQENDLFLYYIGTTKSGVSDSYWTNSSGNDFEKIIGDIQVPNDAKGTFPGAPDGDRSLKYFIPENPNLANIDSNYVFGGWGLSPLPDSPTVDVNELKMGTSAFTLYAKWVAPKEKVTFTQVTVPKTETVASTVVLDNQTYNQKLTGTIPTATEFENFYFQYWYYYEDDAAKEEGQRTYFDPLNSPVPAHDIVLYPEYSSTEANTEFLVSPVNKPEEFHGSIDPDELFYVKSNEAFTKADADGLTIKEWDFGEQEFVDRTIVPTPNEGYMFVKWQLTYGTAQDYNDIEVGTDSAKVTGACGVKAVFEPEATSVDVPTWKNDITYDGKEHDVSVDPDTYWDGFDVDAMTIEGTVTGTAVGTYTATFRLKDGYVWKDQEASIRTANVQWNIVDEPEPVAVDVPTWNEDILYDASEHDVSATTYWTNYNTDAMEIGGTVTGTDPNTYTATFTLKGGYVWKGEPASTEPVNVDWKIVATEVPVPTWKADITYDAQEHNVDNVELWSGYNKTAMTIGGTTTGTEVGEYTATFTLNNGYVFADEEVSTRSVDVIWKIVDAPDVPVDVPTWNEDILYDATEHDVSATTYWTNYNTDAMEIGGTVSGIDPATYTATFTLKKGYVWNTDPASKEPVNVDWKIVATEVPVPTWKADITYDEKSHNVSTTDYWNNFNTTAMTIGGEVEGTEAKEYTATFTLNNGYVFAGKEVSTRSVDATWKIVAPTPVKPKQETETEVLPDGFYVKQFGKMEVTGIQENPTMHWELITTEEEFPGRFEFNSQDTTYVAYIKATVAGMTKAILHIDETESFDATDVEVIFEILPQKVEEIDLEESYSVNAGNSIDVEAGGLTSGRMVKWEIVSGADKVQLKYVNNNPVSVIGVAEGAATIKITALESIQYAEVSATTTISVGGKQDQDIDLVVAPDVYVGEYGSIEAQGIQDNPALTWSIVGGATDAIEFVSGTDKDIVNYKALKAGITQVKLTVAETDRYNATEVVVSVETKGKIVQEITFDKDLYEVNVGSSINITANGLSATRDISWEIINDEGFAALNYVKNNPVRVVGLEVGTATVKITASEQQYYAETSATVQVKVNGKPTQDITINAPSSINVGSTVNAAVENVKEKADVQWNVEDDTTLQIVSGAQELNAKVRGLKEGKTKLKVTTSATETYAQTTAELEITVTDTGVAFLMPRDEAIRDSIIKPFRDATSVKFSSNDPTIYSTDEEDIIDVSINHDSSINAYRVHDGSTYHVVIASPLKIAASSTSCKSLFKYFRNMKTVDLGDLILDNATELGAMFEICESLTEVNLATTSANGFNTSNVTSFIYMFDGCKNLEKITLDSNFIVKDNAALDGMFMSCPKLGVILVPQGTDWSGKSGTSKDMFMSSKALPGFDERKTTREMAYAGKKSGVQGYFMDGTESEVAFMKDRGNDGVSIINEYNNATSVTFSSKDDTKYSDDFVDISYNKAFPVYAYKVNDSNGYHVVIASSYKLAAHDISLKSIFKNFYNLTSVDFGSLDCSNVTDLGAMFNVCKKIKEIDLTGPVANGLQFANVNSFIYMFEFCYELRSVKLGDNFVVSDTAKLDGMFNGCTKLLTIQVPQGTDWSNGTGSSTNMFAGCKSLPGFDVAKLDRKMAYVGYKNGIKGYLYDGTETDLAYLANRPSSGQSLITEFKDATSVKFSSKDTKIYSNESIDVSYDKNYAVLAYKVPNEDDSGYHVVVASPFNIGCSATSLKTIFKNFKNLKQVDFGNLNCEDATDLAGMFDVCSSLEQIDLTTLVANGLNCENVTSLAYMFEYCYELRYVNMGDTFYIATNTQTQSMFSQCVKLVTIQVKQGTDWSGGTGSSAGMFSGCTALPGFDATHVGRDRAYAGYKDGVKGYLYDASLTDVAYLANRVGTDGILNDYNEATSVKFSSKDTTIYSNTYVDVSLDKHYAILAYKVQNENDSGYHVVVASPFNIGASSTSLKCIFKNFKKLTSVDFGNLDCSQAQELGGMFDVCTSMTTIDITPLLSTLDFTKITAYNSMFEYCYNVTTINLGSFNVSDTAFIDCMFMSCMNLTKIQVAPGVDWSNGTGSSNNMFAGCTKLIGTTGGVDRSYAFAGTKGDKKGYFDDGSSSFMKSKTAYMKNRGAASASVISDYNNATSVTFASQDNNQYSNEYINVSEDSNYPVYAYKVVDSDGSYHVVIASKYNIAVNTTTCKCLFKGFSKLTSVNFGNLDFTKAVEMGAMFELCKSLTSINLSSTNVNGFNTKNVTSYIYMFNGCSKLTTIVFGEGFVLNDAAVLDYMFTNCGSLKTIKSPVTNWTNSSASSINMFSGCTSLAGYNVSNKCDRTLAYAGTINGVKGYLSI